MQHVILLPISYVALSLRSSLKYTHTNTG